jgi:hypothetical protein
MRTPCLLLLLILTSCQQPSAEVPTPAVRLRFPQSLKVPAIRWRNFLSRVIHLEIKVRNGKGAPQVVVAGPLSWEGLTLDSWERPPADTPVTIEAKVWDRDERDIPRSYPAVEGSAKVRADAWDQTQEIELKMALKVSVKEYD